MTNAPVSTGLREPCTVESVGYSTEDHGILTCWLRLSCGQSFGGLCLNPLARGQGGEVLLGPDFAASVCSLFDVEFTGPEESLTLLVGKRCFALRCFEEWNSPIEGIEAESGARFTLTAWRRKFFPATADVLTEKTTRLREEIAEHGRRAEQLRDSLGSLESRYHDWEAP
jgi:hypothetical protein